MISIGLLFTVYTTSRLLVEEHVTDPTRKGAEQVKIHHQIWEPLLGSIMVMVGVGIYMISRKKAEAKHAGPVLMN